MALTNIQIDKLTKFGVIATKVNESISVSCDSCKVEFKIRVKALLKKSYYKIYCANCRYNSPEFKKSLSKVVSTRWKNNIYDNDVMRRRNDIKFKKESSLRSKKLWKQKNFAEKIKINTNYSEIALKLHKYMLDNKDVISKRSKEFWKDKEYADKIKQVSLNQWKDEEYINKTLEAIMSKESRGKISDSAKESWKNHEYRRTQCDRLANLPKVSSLQETLYSLLDDLNIKYYREYNDKKDDKECIIGPYSFDCVIPRENQRDLLIECQGEFWHLQPKNSRRDRSKATYISNNLSHKYELRYIWGHEFKCLDKVSESLKYWLKLTQVSIKDYCFKSLKINLCKATEYKLLLSKYHYLSNAGRGGISFGAYLDNCLIAVCIFSPLIRQNIPFDNNTTRELSRFCIVPQFQKKNLASWFISHCIKLLDPKYKEIIAYSDTTFNHFGTIYKAANFELDSEIRPDYWYIDQTGWAMHKKTLYEQAKSLTMTENEFADKFGYHKVYGDKKYRYKLRRRS